MSKLVADILCFVFKIEIFIGFDILQYRGENILAEKYTLINCTASVKCFLWLCFKAYHVVCQIILEDTCYAQTLYNPTSKLCNVFEKDKM